MQENETSHLVTPNCESTQFSPPALPFLLTIAIEELNENTSYGKLILKLQLSLTEIRAYIVNGAAFAFLLIKRGKQKIGGLMI